MSEGPTIREVWGDEVYPPYVLSAAERHRWDLCHELATKVSATCEASGVADSQVVWYLERELYASPLPVDDAERDARLAEADAGDGFRAEAALERLERLPAPQHGQDGWYVAAVACDALDALMGDPAGWDLGEYEEPDPGELRALMEGVGFAERLHPRDRLGQWRRKLEALRSFVRANRHLLTVKGRGGHDAAAASAGRHPPERAVAELAGKENISPEQARARLAAEARRGLGAGRRARAAGTVALGTLLTHIAAAETGEGAGEAALSWVGVGQHERTTGERFESAVGNVGNAVETGHLAAHAAGGLARWAAEHHDEVKKLAALAHHLLRLKGLAAAALEQDEGAEELAIVEAVLGEPTES